jgi:hypothetical protein
MSREDYKRKLEAEEIEAGLEKAPEDDDDDTCEVKDKAEKFVGD